MYDRDREREREIILITELSSFISSFSFEKDLQQGFFI
jgi:hypothetical protein